MTFSKKFKVAIVHDDFIQFGGAEKLIFEISKKLKANPEFEVRIFSSLISPQWKKILHTNNLNYQESFLRFIPFCYSISKLFFIPNFFYLAFQNFNFDNYSVVFSSSTRFGHSVITKPKTLHISYINSPAKMLWSTSEYFKKNQFIFKLISRLLSNKRIIDDVTQNYSDLIISNSKNIKKKVQRFYSKKSLVLYPFADIGFQIRPKGDYYVLVSRLVAWKRIDYVIKAFNLLNVKLIVIGSGPDLHTLKGISNNNIEFKGYVSEIEKKEIISRALALVFPQNEDFGITIVESLCLGTPIIYYNKGGAREILNDKLGEAYEIQDASSLTTAIISNNKKLYNPEELLLAGSKFSSAQFIKFLEKLILTQVKVKKS